MSNAPGNHLIPPHDEEMRLLTAFMRAAATREARLSKAEIDEILGQWTLPSSPGGRENGPTVPHQRPPSE